MNIADEIRKRANLAAAMLDFGAKDGDRKDKILAAQHGIPKAFRQHATRYGSGVDGIVAAGKKYPAALTLDQAAAVRRAERAAR